MSTVPVPAKAGLVTVQEVALQAPTTLPVPARPKVTRLTPSRLLPVIRTVVLPAGSPRFGEIAVITGGVPPAPAAVKVNWLPEVNEVAPTVAVILTAPPPGTDGVRTVQ